MSKDFELLRRMEEGQQSSSSPTSEEILSDCDSSTLEALSSLITPFKSCAGLLPTFTRRQLESMLRTACSTSAPRVLVFCGVDADSDAGFITACASELLSKTANGPVCVFDVSSAGDCVSDLFGLQKPAGSRGEAPLYSRIDENLWVVALPNADLSAFSLADDLENWMTDLRNNFSHVLVHGDPVALSPVTGVVGRLSDGIVLVIEAESTDRELTKQVKTELESANVQILGAILNKFRNPIPRRINDWLKAS
jgi:hypothetical protein